ncbi:MAG: hypothetical protein JSV24_09275 [Bacteroidales bacterium]|nr:MAG: hypothetical protein JSV24_09275 [Bacteroidales bacterium]
MMSRSQSGKRVKSRPGQIPAILTTVVVLSGLTLIIYFFTFKDLSRKRRIDRNAGEVRGYVYNADKKELMTHGVDGTKVSNKYVLFIRYRVGGRDFLITKTLSYPYLKDSVTVRYNLLNPEEAYVVIK